MGKEGGRRRKSGNAGGLQAQRISIVSIVFSPRDMNFEARDRMGSTSNRIGIRKAWQCRVMSHREVKSGFTSLELAHGKFSCKYKLVCNAARTKEEGQIMRYEMRC